MRLRLLIATAIILLGSIATHAQETYSRVRIYFDAGHNISQLAALGVTVDHGEHKKGYWFSTDCSASEISRARATGFNVEVLIPDVTRYYQEQNKVAHKTTAGADCNTILPDVPAHFHLGTYGGYFTYAEMLQILDSMVLLYPSLVSPVYPIDTFHSIEGRPIYWLRISNNPTVEQPAKPQMLVTSLHHAREPGSLSSNIFFLWYLLEHYATDARIKTIIDNTELYFVPCVNPDGYLFNITASPGGGGMWRKNRRNNGDGTMGVDLNRNYGHTFAYDDIGSSPMTSSDTYRGTAAFSEPETKAIKWLAEHHSFKIDLNYHTYNNDVVYPWGHIASYQTDDSDRYFAWGSYLTQYNHYRFGTCDQTLGYITNGDADDWMYGETTSKNRVFAMTPEIGANEFGFYTLIENIIPDCQNNLLANINAASLLLPFASLKNADDKILLNPSGYLHYDIQRLGFPDNDTFTVRILPLDSWLTVPPTPKVYTGMDILDKTSDSMSYTLSAATPNGQLIRYVLQVYNGLYYLNDTVSFYYGKQHTVTTPSMSTLADWTSAGWSVCTSSWYSAPSSIKSSPVCTDNYDDGADYTLELTEPLDLTHSMQAYLRFYGKWAVESAFDYVNVQAAPVGSGMWQNLCGNYTRPGTMYQAHDEPLYDGHQPLWVKEDINLANYLGQQVKLRFELISDAGGNFAGFSVDDVEIRTVQDTPVAVGNVSGLPSIRVHPNPATTELNVSLGTTPVIPLTGVIYDCVGREASRFIIADHTASVDVSTLVAGVYFLKVGNDDVRFPVQKVVIKR